MVSSEFLAHSTDLPFQRKGIAMSLCFSGLHTPCRAAPIVIEVAANPLFIQLALVIPWHALAEMVLPDLKRTTPKGKWWLGGQLKLRIQGESSDVTSVLCCSSGSMISPTDKSTGPLRTTPPTSSFVAAASLRTGMRPTTPRLKSFARVCLPRRNDKSPIKWQSGPPS